MAEATEGTVVEQGEQGDLQEGPSEEIVAAAKAMGWADKDKWRGDPDKWIPADKFLEHGQVVVPILRKSNEELRQQSRQQAEELATLKASLKAATVAIKALQDSHAEDVKAQVEAARMELKDQLAAAMADGNHARAAELTDKLTDLKAAERAAVKREDEAAAAGAEDVKAAVPNAEVVAWQDANPWFNGGTKDNKRLTHMTLVMARELREEGSMLVGRAFMDAAAQRAREELGVGAADRSPGAGKVEGGTGGGSRSGGGGGAKGFESLPAEAKQACDQQAKHVVGPNRKFKDQASWRKEYARIYHEQN